MPSDGDTFEGVGPGWYVIECPHQDPATVARGPLPKDEAASHVMHLQQSKVMHTPALVHAVKNNDYNVRWAEAATKPSALREDDE